MIDDAVYDEFFRDREAFVHRWAAPVFLDTTANFIGLGFDMVHFVNRDGVTGELAIGKPSSMLAMHGGPLWEPLCYAQIGGLTVATFLTLLLVPVIYTMVVRDLGWIRWGDEPRRHEDTKA